MVQLGTGQEHTVPLYDKKGQTTGELRFRAQEEQVCLAVATPAVHQLAEHNTWRQTNC
jgi:hypothetical protein